MGIISIYKLKRTWRAVYRPASSSCITRERLLERTGFPAPFISANPCDKFVLMAWNGSNRAPLSGPVRNGRAFSKCSPVLIGCRGWPDLRQSHMIEELPGPQLPERGQLHRLGMLAPNCSVRNSLQCMKPLKCWRFCVTGARVILKENSPALHFKLGTQIPLQGQLCKFDPLSLQRL